jgi:hypothetical protein
MIIPLSVISKKIEMKRLKEDKRQAIAQQQQQTK